MRILFVDDDPDIRTIIRMALALDPALILTEAASGAEALALLSHGVLPDVMLLDVMMPGLDGPVVLDRLRANVATADVPVIVMTAKARTADTALYRSAGAIGVITKPFDPLDLARQVRALAGDAARSARA